jgi:preprotein translocase subunit SecG
MRILLNCVHVLAAMVMIVVVLLQQGKGADIGAAFGAGSSQTLFGSRGAGNFLTKMTTAFVMIFMGTSIWLSYLTTPRSVIEGIEQPPATEAPAT